MTVSTLSFAIDFGLVVLIWLVQLIIYPSLATQARNSSQHRHRKYMLRMGFVAAPLMTAQLILHALLLYQELTAIRLVMALMVLSVWSLTFILFVPLHNELASGRESVTSAKKLVRYNWWRTGIWSAIFLLSLWGQ